MAEDVALAAAKDGYTPLQARILAARLTSPDRLAGIAGHLRDLDPPATLPDIDLAADAIAIAITDPTRVLSCVTDHDCDGACAHFVLMSAMLGDFHLRPDRFMPFITHRMREGYGVSDAATTRMLADIPQNALLITADQGSTDEARIARLKAERGVTTIVTDHHGIPEEGPPKSALACVNPVRKDSSYDPHVAGCMVAWLTMCAVRTKLIEQGWLRPDAPSLAHLLDVVAVGTCADAVDLATSKNNRIVMTYGLRLMNRDNARPCWKALHQVMRKTTPFTVRDLGFGICPRINAIGRIGDAMASVNLLAAATYDEALPLAQALDEDNRKRREIQHAMTDTALEIGAKLAADGKPALVVHLPEGHAGVHGIVASRLLEIHGRPTCCLSPDPNDPNAVRGSLRSIPEVDIRAALAEAAKSLPGLRFGGHPGAAGVTLQVRDIPVFADALCAAVAQQVDIAKLHGHIDTDGELPSSPSMSVIAEIEALEPYGRAFEPPRFDGVFTVVRVKQVGDGSHIKLSLQADDGTVCDAIWFHAKAADAPLPFGPETRKRVIYSLETNTYRGESRAQLTVTGVSDP
ncbi:MAG TPA: DHHA1 domain-containing protein [Nevskiaceae bacterium]|nr:DHHA1 domain-containing protein [Nevskiaceae bacterium]